jgi:hypothetical protein
MRWIGIFISPGQGRSLNFSHTLPPIKKVLFLAVNAKQGRINNVSIVGQRDANKHLSLFNHTPLGIDYVEPNISQQHYYANWYLL